MNKIKSFRELLSILFDSDKVEVYKELFSDSDNNERTFNTKLLYMYKNDQITEKALLDYFEATQGEIFDTLSQIDLPF